MEEAFRRLAQLEPRLLDIQLTVKLPGARPDEHGGLPKSIRHDLGPLVGGGADSENELLRSNLASSVVSQYLQALLDPSVMGGVDVSYWAAPRKVAVVSGAFTRSRRASGSTS